MFLSVLKFHFIATPAPILTPLCFEISTCLLKEAVEAEHAFIAESGLLDTSEANHVWLP